MKRRKAKATKSAAKKVSAAAAQEGFAALDAAVVSEIAKQRRQQEAEHQREQRQLWKLIEAERRKLPKRDLSQVKFPHWWKERAFIQELTEGRIPIEEQKASLWYEAARRRAEVQRAWLKGKFNFGDNGWQSFTTWAILNLLRPWPEVAKLDANTKHGIIEASYSPWSVPPEGYSTFPETHRAEQRKVSMQVLRLPKSSDAKEAQGFVERARRFADAGFLIVAVDKKQNQAVRAACEAIEALPPTFRKADVKPVMFLFSPPDISAEDKQALEEKQRQGTLTEQDSADIWRKYIKPTSNLHAPWHNTAEVQERVFHKRERQGKLIEKKQFNFESICRQLESFDNGCISEFVSSVRL